jgi:hypothetical protein
LIWPRASAKLASQVLLLGHPLASGAGCKGGSVDLKDQPGRSRLWITPPLYFSSLVMRMALSYADAAGAEPDAVKRSELLDLCMTCWRQAQLLRRWPGIAGRA